MRGFTLVELLVVIVIIAILASFLLVGIFAAMRTSKINATQTLLQSLSLSLERYKQREGDYPPTYLPGLPNRVNGGIESMTACLADNRRELLLQVQDEALYSNTDGDQATRNLTGWFFGDLQLREITDLFGHPLVYFHSRDYRTPATLRLRGADVEVKAEWNDSLRAYRNPDSAQLFSVGPDGVPGTEDDIRP